MRRFFILLATLLPLLGALGTTPADARLGGGFSFGSRGSFSFRPPRPTNLAPGVASLPRSQAPMGGYGAPGGYGFNRRPFMSGLMGGFIGAGILGLLFGGGFLRGGLGFGGLFGVLLQLVILFFIIRWLMRRFLGGRAGGPMGGPQPSIFTPPVNRPNVAPYQVTREDQQAFAQCLVYVQQAWGAGDLRAIAQAATPEMMGYFQDQFATLSRQGLRNRVSNISVDGMELSEAWSEGSSDFATVALRFSMLDVTEDSRGQVVDGSPTVRALVTEVWTFMRSRGSHWILAAIQQTS